MLLRYFAKPPSSTVGENVRYPRAEIDSPPGSLVEGDSLLTIDVFLLSYIFKD